MEFYNFSQEETKQIQRALGFIGAKEVALAPVLARTLILKTENFAQDCQELSAYFAQMGLEDSNACLAFNPDETGSHKVLLNKDTVVGLSYIHSLVMQIVHLGNLTRFNAEYGNIYRLEPEQAISNYYYEFLLWTRFQAMHLATRAHALVSWHAVNGDAPPPDGKYQFSAVHFPVEPVEQHLAKLTAVTDVSDWRTELWGFLAELAYYFGRLTFYQHTAEPLAVDDRFPAGTIEATVGLETTLRFYAVLQQSKNYAAWQENRKELRKLIIEMQGKKQE